MEVEIRFWLWLVLGAKYGKAHSQLANNNAVAEVCALPRAL